MISFPNAKINLGLNVLCKRDDGFHDIETVFYPVKLHDSLEIIPKTRGVTSLESYGIEIPAKDNLCIKAYDLIRGEYDISPVEFHLLKQIPAGAGLGGGSSDASHSLMMLNDIFKLDISSAGIERKAALIGSDCAFFIRNKPVFAYGRGEQFENIELDLSGKYILLAKPNIHISTHEAYSLVQAREGRPSPREIIQRPIGVWKDVLVNDFEGPIFKKYPEIHGIKDTMYDMGAVYASMSGSGSAVYGIFENDPSSRLSLITRHSVVGTQLFLCRP